MPDPTISTTIDGYELTWSSGVSIAARRLKVHSDGRITCQIYIYSGNTRLYPETQTNLTSNVSRDRLITALKKTTEAYDWQTIIFQMSQALQQLVREGEPVQELWTHEANSELQWVLEPFLIRGLPTVIFGEKGVLKSTLSLILYTCLTLPWVDNPLGVSAPPSPVRTLYLDWELPGDIAQRNLRNISTGMGLPNLPLLHRRCRRPLAEDLEQIANHIHQHHVDVVIIDSLARACGGELVKAEPANDFFEALDRLNVTSLIVAQTSKEETGKRRKTIYGNALFTYYARSIWELCKADAIGDIDEVNIALFNRWANLSREYSPLGYRVTFGPGVTTIERNSVSLHDFANKVNTGAAIVDALRSGPKSVSQITEEIDATENAVRLQLSKLGKRGLVVNMARGTWGLAERTP